MKGNARSIQAEGFIPKDLRVKGIKSNTVVRKAAKVHRNDPCPCGNGKKAKNCCYSPYK